MRVRQMRLSGRRQFKRSELRAGHLDSALVAMPLAEQRPLNEVTRVADSRALLMANVLSLRRSTIMLPPAA